jgi:hypothetical protein
MSGLASDADFGRVYNSSVSVGDVGAGSFLGSGVPTTFGGVVIGPDFELPEGMTSGSFTLWIDELVIDSAPIHCQ